mmetsp:Transcript_28654/g.66046  ORF Transcript_28654/g.66046 Transcript_28654/m.66046 type:complete len:216 (+) Transcript_28654:1562-2209(+)
MSSSSTPSSRTSARESVPTVAPIVALRELSRRRSAASARRSSPATLQPALARSLAARCRPSPCARRTAAWRRRCARARPRPSTPAAARRSASRRQCAPRPPRPRGRASRGGLAGRSAAGPRQPNKHRAALPKPWPSPSRLALRTSRLRAVRPNSRRRLRRTPSAPAVAPGRPRRPFAALLAAPARQASVRPSARLVSGARRPSVSRRRPAASRRT